MEVDFDVRPATFASDFGPEPQDPIPYGTEIIDRSEELAWIQKRGKQFSGYWVLIHAGQLLVIGNRQRDLVHHPIARRLAVETGRWPYIGLIP